MTRQDALRALLAHVEAGTATGGPDALAVPRDQSRLIHAAFGDDDEIWSNVVAAHDGSLDAAKALHEAVLPGWTWKVWADATGSVASVRHVLKHAAWVHSFNDEPARAWLIAIIRALIEETTE